MRCPDCNKFASYDTEYEPEIDSESVDGTANFHVEDKTSASSMDELT